MKTSNRKNERGIALILALLALLLISAVGLGMIYMSSTETSINSNYKDTQVGFFAMRGGLEEMRDRLRADSSAPISASVALPTTLMPSATAGSIIYITNPAASEVVDPLSSTNAYFDDEFCHEQFSGLTWLAPGTKCPPADAAPSGKPYIASVAQRTTTAASMKYKWVRLTLKQNGTGGTPTNSSSWVDSTQAAGSQVCWDATNQMERVSTAMGGAANCSLVTTNYVEPVYLVTSMAITPSGSRRVGQYEVSAFNIAPPPGGVSLDGPAPTFGPPHSNKGGINGTDQSGTPPAVPGCSTNLGAQPGIGVDNSADATVVTNEITGTPGSKPTNFTGSGTGTPSVVPSNYTNWSTVSGLNTLAQEMANAADLTCTGNTGASCAKNGTYGTTSPYAPQITYVNGNFEMSNGGAGVLVVTGNLTLDGGLNFNGLILVIGTGSVTINGGGGGNVYGEIFVANTSTGVMGNPSFQWNGGGTASINYNSCWANIGNNLHYIVVASREEMY